MLYADLEFNSGRSHLTNISLHDSENVHLGERHLIGAPKLSDYSIIYSVR